MADDTPNKNHSEDVAFIRALAELLNENDLTELEVKRDYGSEDSLNVRVSRKQKVIAGAVMSPQGATTLPTPQLTAAQSDPGASHAAAESNRDEDPASLPGAVTSPMVGTVYLQPEPNAAAFVSIGDKVVEGDTLLIIEAMKTMNHIPAPRSGTVKRILIEDGAAVEYGAPLMVLE
ncbi:MAG: acetyl-CoA carboxylase biotin carboxyl carrier protein [Pseudomonadota bacterium]